MMKQMRKDGLEPDAYTYSGVITACGKGRKATKALSLLDEMVEQYGEHRAEKYPIRHRGRSVT